MHTYIHTPFDTRLISYCCDTGPNAFEEMGQQIYALQLDLRLKEADKRFLEAELVNKEELLAKITQGLREVSEPDVCLSRDDCVLNQRQR